MDDPLDSHSLYELIETLKVGTIPLTPFIGAGISANFGMPTWNDLLLEQCANNTTALKILKSKRIGKFEEAAQEISNKLPHVFNQIIAKTFRESKFDNALLSGTPLEYLTKYPPALVLTTNYDSIVETAFDSINKPFEDVHSGALIDSDGTSLTKLISSNSLVKLHGDAQKPASIIFSKTQYDQNYINPSGSLDLTRPLAAILACCAATKIFLFIGCSLSSDRYLKILTYGRKAGPKHYAIVEKPNTEKKTNLRWEFLNRHHIEPIWIPAGEFGYVSLILRKIAKDLSYLNEIESIRDRYEINSSAWDEQDIDLSSEFTTLLYKHEELASSEFRLLTNPNSLIIKKSKLPIEVIGTPWFVDDTGTNIQSMFLEGAYPQCFYYYPNGKQGGGPKFTFYINQDKQNVSLNIVSASNKLVSIKLQGI